MTKTNSIIIKKILILFFFGFFLYLPSLFFDFSFFDDNVLILEHLGFLRNLTNIFNVFFTDVFGVYLKKEGFYYRPILTVSFMIDALISGTHPFFYHLSNILIHLLTTILVFLFFQKIKFEEKKAFYLSLLFLIHPVLTQAVAWIPGRNDSLLALFFLASFIFFIDFLQKNKNQSLLLHFLFLLLAFLTKETIVVAPLILFFYFWFFVKEKNEKQIFLSIIGWFVIFIFWFFLRLLAIGNLVYLDKKEIFLSLLKNFPAVFIFLRKIVFPFKLSVLPLLSDEKIFYGGLVLFLIVIGLFWNKKRDDKKIIFGFFWFLFFLIPSFIRPNTTSPADFLEHRVYLSLVGFLIVFSQTILFQKVFEKNIYQLLFFLTLLLLVVKTFFHQFNFLNRDVFWQAAVNNSPNSPLAHRNFGVMLYFRGKLKEAEEEYRKALKINPQEPMAHNNLGVIYLKKGNLNKAEAEFKKELEINPNYDNAFFNLGLVYFKKNKLNEAQDYFERTIKVNPSYTDAYQLLAVVFEKKGEKKQAIKYFLIWKNLVNQ